MANVEDGVIRAPNLRGARDVTLEASMEPDGHVCGITADPKGSVA